MTPELQDVLNQADALLADARPQSTDIERILLMLVSVDAWAAGVLLKRGINLDEARRRAREQLKSEKSKQSE